MATILEFKITPRLFADSLGDGSRPADILFFPGIRYQRQADDAESESEDPALTGRTLRRDTLELES